MVSVYEFGGMNAFWVDGRSEYVLAMPGQWIVPLRPPEG